MDKIDKVFIVLQGVLVVILMGVVLYMGISLSNKHDSEVMKAGDMYTQCVRSNYHTTPAQFYARHNYYPLCK